MSRHQQGPPAGYREPQRQQAIDLSDITVADGIPQLDNFDKVLRYCEWRERTRTLPAGFKSAADAAIAISAGAKVGLSIDAALSGVMVVNQRASLWGDALLGVVQGSGLCLDIDEYYEWEGERIDDEVAGRIIADAGQKAPRGLTAVTVSQRKGRPEPVRRSFSVGDAVKAGLWSKSGPWATYPTRMLRMRARAFNLRDNFADTLQGMSVAEEMLDAITVAETPQIRRPIARPAAAATNPADVDVQRPPAHTEPSASAQTPGAGASAQAPLSPQTATPAPSSVHEANGGAEQDPESSAGVEPAPPPLPNGPPYIGEADWKHFWRVGREAFASDGAGRDNALMAWLRNEYGLRHREIPAARFEEVMASLALKLPEPGSEG